MLYYLRQEVIGDLAERILEGADSRLVSPSLPPSLSQPDVHAWIMCGRVCHPDALHIFTVCVCDHLAVDIDFEKWLNERWSVGCFLPVCVIF